MFGNPVSNEKRWVTEAMHKVAPIVNYKGNIGNEIWLLNLDMVEAQTGRILEYIMVPKNNIGSSICQFDTSNVLYSKLRPYLNKVVIPDRCGCATSEMLPLQPVQGKLNRTYFAYMLRNNEFVSMINEKVSGAKMPRVSTDELKNFKMPLPTLKMQNEFADFVRQVDKSKLPNILIIYTLFVGMAYTLPGTLALYLCAKLSPVNGDMGVPFQVRSRYFSRLAVLKLS